MKGGINRVEKKVDWDLLKDTDWKKIYDEMLNHKPSFDNQTNKDKLLFMIYKATGIEFKEISISANDKYRVTLFTDRVRPDMGIVGKYIYKFSFSLHYREPTIEEDGNIILSFCPSLGYELASKGSNGFETDCWFYYSINNKTWYLK